MTEFSDPLYSIRQVPQWQWTRDMWLYQIEMGNKIKVDSYTEREMLVANLLWVLMSSVIAF